MNQETVKNTVSRRKNYSKKDEKTVKNTVLDQDETVKITACICNFYSENTVKITAPLNDLNKSLNEDLVVATTTENKAVAAADTEVGLSKFSKEECLRYAQISKANGDPIRSVNAVARHAFLTGESDVYIQATLYPEKVEETPADDARAEALKLLREVQADGDDVDDYKKWYSEDDWQWLMRELEK